MKSLPEVDLRFVTEFEKKYKSLPLDQYLEFLKNALSSDFRNLDLLFPQFESVLKGTTENLIDITLVLAILERDTATKITFLINHIISQLEYRKNYLDGEMYNYINKEVLNLAELCRIYLNFYKQNEESLLKYVEYNTYIHQGGEKVTFLQYRNR